MDVRSLTKAVGRAGSKAWRDSWPVSLFRRIIRDRFPKPVLSSEREDTINVHQLCAGHWGLGRTSLHRIGRHPTRNCQQCGDLRCPAALCEVCRGEADTPTHVLLRCPCLAGTRLRLFGTIHPDTTQLREAEPWRPWRAATCSTGSHWATAVRRPARGGAATTITSTTLPGEENNHPPMKWKTCKQTAWDPPVTWNTSGL